MPAKKRNRTKTGQSEGDRLLAEECGVTLERVDEYREIFQLVDQDKSGSITHEELFALTDLMNMKATEEEIKQMVQGIGSVGDGDILFEDLVRSLSRVPKVGYTEKQVLDAFRRLAGPKSPPGKISVPVLEHALGHFGPGMPMEQVTDVVAKIDKPPDSDLVDYAQFVHLMMDAARD